MSNGLRATFIPNMGKYVAINTASGRIYTSHLLKWDCSAALLFLPETKLSALRSFIVSIILP